LISKGVTKEFSTKKYQPSRAERAQNCATISGDGEKTTEHNLGYNILRESDRKVIYSLYVKFYEYLPIEPLENTNENYDSFYDMLKIQAVKELENTENSEMAEDDDIMEDDDCNTQSIAQETLIDEAIQLVEITGTLFWPSPIFLRTFLELFTTISNSCL
jgi:hypothetical protein